MKRSLFALLLLLALLPGCACAPAAGPAPSRSAQAPGRPAEAIARRRLSPLSAWADPAVGYIMTAALLRDDFAAFEQAFCSDQANPYTSDACFYAYLSLWDGYRAERGLSLTPEALAQVREVSVYRLGDQTLADVCCYDEAQGKALWHSTVLPDGIRLASVDDFRRFPRLTRLELIGNTTVRSFRALAALPGLESFAIRLNDEFYIDGLSELSALRELGLYAGPWPITEEMLVQIGGIRGLTSLRLSGVNAAGLSGLLPLRGLTELSLSASHIADWSGLSQLPRLETLRLTGGTLSELSPLAGLSGLRSLDLTDNHIADAAPLAGLSGLKSLSLRCNDIADAAPLAALADSLDELDLSYNRIADLSPLGRFAGDPLCAAGNPGFAH